MLKFTKEQTIVFNGKKRGKKGIKNLKIIKNDKHIQPKENLSKINRPLDDTMQGFQ